MRPLIWGGFSRCCQRPPSQGHYSQICYCNTFCLLTWGSSLYRGGGAVPWFQVCSKEPPSAKDGSDSKLTVIPVLSLEVIPRRVLHRGCSVGREVTLQMHPSWSLFPSLSHPLPRSPNLLPPSSAKTSYLHSNLSFGVSFEENLAQFGRSWMLNGKWW